MVTVVVYSRIYRRLVPKGSQRGGHAYEPRANLPGPAALHTITIEDIMQTVTFMRPYYLLQILYSIITTIMKKIQCSQQRHRLVPMRYLHECTLTTTRSDATENNWIRPTLSTTINNSGKVDNISDMNDRHPGQWPACLDTLHIYDVLGFFAPRRRQYVLYKF